MLHRYLFMLHRYLLMLHRFWLMLHRFSPMLHRPYFQDKHEAWTIFGPGSA